MNISEKVRMLAQLKGVLDPDRYRSVMNKTGCYRKKYSSTLSSQPADIAKEMAVLDNADFETCCNLLSMLVNEGSFEKNYFNGYVLNTLDRMDMLLNKKLLEQI